MRLTRYVVLSIVGALMAGCGGTSAAPAAKAVPAAAKVDLAAAAADTQVYAPVLDHDAIHSKADARAVANQALDLATFPAGSVRLTSRPAAGLAITGATTGATTQVNLTRWESVPGTVIDAAAWVVAHAAAGTGIVSQASGEDASLDWTTARAFHYLPFFLSAWLAPDGDHVDVTLSANVIWTPKKTAVETIPASLHSALLDYGEGNNTFGTSSRHVVTGTDLDQLRTAINALGTAPLGARSCPANFGDSTTLTLSYGGHLVVMQGDKCGETSVLSDGHAQPTLNGEPYSITARLAASATPAPATYVARAALLTDLFSKAAAERRASALAQLITFSPQAHETGRPDAEYPPVNVATQSRSVAWTGSVPGVVDYLTAHLPHGFVVAHVGPTYAGSTAVILQPAHVYPASSLISLRVSRRGSSVTLRIDGEAAWLTPRAPYELIPENTATARATSYPQNGPRTRVLLTGKAVRALTHAFDSSKPARPYLLCPAGSATQPLKLEVVYHVGKHVVTFYWYNNDCVLGALVDGRRATGLSDPPTALVERLLHWKSQRVRSAPPSTGSTMPVR